MGGTVRGKEIPMANNDKANKVKPDTGTGSPAPRDPGADRAAGSPEKAGGSLKGGTPQEQKPPDHEPKP